MADGAGPGQERFTRDDARVSLVVRGQEFTGWQQTEVARSLEALAGRFSVQVPVVPGQPPDIQRQDPVQVRIGDTPVIDGYVLSAEPYYRRADCGMRVVGRDRAGDLIRCTAVHRGGQWVRAGLERIARDLIAPYGLGLVVETDLGGPIADFKLAHGETVLDALARAARLRGVLVTCDAQGRVLLTTAGKLRFKGTIRRGWNVITMEGVGTDDDRHSEYTAYGQAEMALALDVGPAGFERSRSLKATARDPEVLRHLPLVINAQGNNTAADLATLVNHTMRVRRGHSMGYRYTVEGWTFGGEPWPVNQRVAVFDDVAGLEGDEWLISSVRHTCDLREGDVTEIVVRPIEAYDTAPLKTRVVHRNWGNRGNSNGGKFRGPTDGASGGAR